MLFIEGLLLGFAVSVPIGPVNLLIMQTALKNHKAALLIGLGALCADLSFLTLIYFGLFSYIDNPTILKTIQILGGIFLFYLAYLSFINRNKALLAKEFENSNLFLVWIKGYFATLLSPFTIVFWLSVSSLLATISGSFWLLIGMIIAIILWILFLVYFIHISKHLLSQTIYKVFNIISALILIYIGIIFIIH